MKRIFSGIQPSGIVHLGNYLGALKNWVALQSEFECLYCAVDLHALTVWQNPEELRENTRITAATLIAVGIDARKHIIFNQSAVSAHAEMAWICNCIARIGWMNRMTQFKEKAGRDRENASLGLLAYPSLMAADILVYKATHVPVGEDQKQHLELTRDIAQKFNHDYGIDFFPLTEPLIFGEATRVMSLRDGTKKMSKSDSSEFAHINLTDPPDTIALKLRKAKTDPQPVPEHPPGSEAQRAERPEAYNLLGIYAALADRPVADVTREYGGKPFSSFKNALADLAVAKLDPIRSELTRLLGDRGAIDAVLRDGAARARALCEPVLDEVKRIVGLLQPR
jgi:tryptophanyl-tRNA synthetase